MNAGVPELIGNSVYDINNLMIGFPDEANLEYNILTYCNFNHTEFEHIRHEYTLSEFYYFAALKKVSVISQIQRK